jgi:hypothetical protein
MGTDPSDPSPGSEELPPGAGGYTEPPPEAYGSIAGYAGGDLRQMQWAQQPPPPTLFQQVAAPFISAGQATAQKAMELAPQHSFVALPLAFLLAAPSAFGSALFGGLAYGIASLGRYLGLLPTGPNMMPSQDMGPGQPLPGAYNGFRQGNPGSGQMAASPFRNAVGSQPPGEGVDAMGYPGVLPGRGRANGMRFPPPPPDITELFRDMLKARQQMAATKDSQKFAASYGRYVEDLDQSIRKVDQYAGQHPHDPGAQYLQKGVNHFVSELMKISKRIDDENLSATLLSKLPDSILDRYRALSPHRGMSGPRPDRIGPVGVTPL